MKAIIEHSPEHGGHIQVAHGATVISLVVTSNSDPTISGIILKPEEAIDLALDLIIQARYLQ